MQKSCEFSEASNEMRAGIWMGGAEHLHYQTGCMIRPWSMSFTEHDFRLEYFTKICEYSKLIHPEILYKLCLAEPTTGYVRWHPPREQPTQCFSLHK